MSLSEDPSLERAAASQHKRFMQAVGSMQYIAVVTRPDLAFAAHVLARHMAGSAKKHWLAVQHVMRYLQCTSDVFTMPSLHVGSPDVHADVEEEHVDRDSEPGSEDSDVNVDSNYEI